MPATARARVRDPHNKVRTSTALQGNAMWENVIGIVNEQAGSNAAVEAMLTAPTIGGGRKQAKARQQAAAQAVLATGGFDTAITNYQSLLSLAQTQGAVGGNATRGACKICGQLGHLTKQCRNQQSKLAGGEGGAGDPLALAAAAAAAAPASDSGLSMSSDSSDSDSDTSRERRRRKEKRKEKKRKHEKEKERRRDKEKKRRKEKKHKKDKKTRSRSRSRSRGRD